MWIEKDDILNKWILFKKEGSAFFEIKRGLQRDLVKYCKGKKWSYKILKNEKIIQRTKQDIISNSKRLKN